MAKALNFLIIAYHYPPMVRVGGRRWHLFVKYMQKAGMAPDVLTCQEGEDGKGDFGESLYRVRPAARSNLPYYKRTLPGNFTGKLQWHASRWLDRTAIALKSIDDRELSVPVQEAFLTRAHELLATQSYDVVVLTVGPFSYAGILPELRKAYPKVTFVLDYRDDWLRDRPELSKRQKSGEIQLEKQVLESVHLVTSVDQNLLRIAQDHHPGAIAQTCVVPHGYDEDDFKGLVPSEPPQQGAAVRAIYGGACYAQVEKYYALLRLFLEHQSTQIHTDFYFTYLSNEVSAAIAALANKKILEPVSRREMLRLHMLEADVNLVIYPDYNDNARTSKFYELIRCGKPLWYFGPNGATAAYIREHGLGITVCSTTDIRKVDYENHIALRPKCSELPERSIPVILDHLLKGIQQVRAQR